MAERNVSDRMSLWCNATPIKDARFKFAPAHLLEQLGAVPAPSMADAVQVFVEANKLPFAEQVEHYKAVKERQSQYFAALDAVHKHFWSMLRDGSLQCIGFEAPRTFAAQPVEVPIKYLEYYPDWEKGSYKHSGLHLIELRVFEVARARSEAVTELPPSVGRPSFKADILEAFAALQEEGKFVEKPLTHGIEQIRTWIKANRPDSRAAQGLLGDDTIRNAIKPLLGKCVAKEVEKL